MITESLGVGDQVVGGVGREIGVRLFGQRSAPATAALVEENHARPVEIEHLRDAPIEASAGSAVEEDGRVAVLVAVHLPGDGVPVTHLEHALVEGLAHGMGNRMSVLRSASSTSVRAQRIGCGSLTAHRSIMSS